MKSILWAVVLAAQVFTASVSPHFQHSDFNGIAQSPVVVTVKATYGAYIKVYLDGPISPISERPVDIDHTMRFEFPRLPYGPYYVRAYLLDTNEKVLAEKDLGEIIILEDEHVQELPAR